MLPNWIRITQITFSGSGVDGLRRFRDVLSHRGPGHQQDQQQRDEEVYLER